MISSLPATWFVPVYLKRCRSDFFWKEHSYQKELTQTLSILDSHMDGEGPGVQSVIPDKPFYTQTEWENFQKTHFIAKTERSFDPYSPETAAGRNVTIGPCQYKGSGRTMGATRDDWLHSWGGMTTREALVEIILEQTLKKKFPHASVPLFAGLFFDDKNSAAIIRSSDFIRCDQVPGVMDPAERSFFLASALRHASETRIYSYHLEQQVKLFRSGFFHRSPTRGNMTIDGRFLDHYSIERMPANPGDYLQMEFRPTVLEMSPEAVIEKGAWDSVMTNYDHLIRQIQVLVDMLKLLEVKVPRHEETREEIRSRFPDHRWIISPGEERLTYKKRIAEIIEAAPHKVLTRTPYGTLLFQMSSFQARKITTFIERKLKVESLAGDPGHVELATILQEGLKLFAHD